VVAACGTHPNDDASTEGQGAVAASTCGSAAEHSNLALACPSGQVITGVTFASYGTPKGSCGSFAKSSCDASDSVSVVSGACLGKSSCTIAANNATFGDPCSGTRKHLDAQVTCGPSTSTDAGADGVASTDGGADADAGADTGAGAGADATAGADAAGGADGATDGAGSSCSSPTIRVTEVDVGAAIDTNEDDADNKPIMISAIPSGGSRLMWNGVDGNVHVTTLNADDTLNAGAGTVSLPGADGEDVYADNGGGVVLLTRNAQGGGTLNCGNPSNLCGTAPSPAIPCYDMYMVRFDGTSETWATQLTQSSASHPPYLNSSTDGTNVIFVWWYAHQGRIVSDGTNYAGYFGSAISVSQNGCVNIHQGDTMKIVSPTGALVGNHGDFDWGCSHSGYERIVWDPAASKFVTICKNDTPTNGKSGQIAYSPSYPYVTMSAVDLWYDNVGNVILGATGGYWLTASDIRSGQTPNSDGLADVHLFHFTTGAPDVNTIIAGTAGSNDRAPHLAKYGGNMLAVWEESTAAGDLAFESSGRTMYLQVLDNATGAAISRPMAVPSTASGPVYGNRYQEFKSYPDGSAAYASAGSSASKVTILRVMPCQ
jgi:hypothetical protein